MSELETNAYAAPTAVEAPSIEAAPAFLCVGSEFSGGIGQRFFGLMLDYGWTTMLGAVAGVVGAIVLVILERSGRISPGWAGRMGAGTISLYVVSALASLSYFAVSEWFGGSSVGKGILGLRVVSEDFRWAGLGQTFVRHLAIFVDLLFFGWPAYSCMKDDPYRQRLGDHWAKTYVIKNAGLPEAQRRPGGRVVLGILIGSAVNVIILAVAIVARELVGK